MFYSSDTLIANLKTIVANYLFIKHPVDKFEPFLVTMNVVEHLQNELVPGITYVIAGINSWSLSSFIFPLSLKVNNTDILYVA